VSLTDRQVTVIGAGVAGLCVARALALRGARVTVLEQADRIAEIGAGLQISPNGGAVLAALGLGAALEAASLGAEAVELRDGGTGALVLRLDLAGRGFRLVHRADLIDLLADGACAAGAEIRLGQRVDRVDLSGPRPLLVTAGGATIESDLLVGADGLRSPVRATLPGARPPAFTGQVAWRATLTTRPGELPVAEVQMAPGRHLVSYPLRGGSLRNIVAVEERAAWTEEGWSLRDDPDALRRAFRDFSPRVRGWLEGVEEVYLWGLFRHPVAPCWHRGRAVVLGDAAHPTLPFLAQGANMALEDAWVLAECLAGETSPETAFAAFEAARVRRCARIVAASGASARLYHLRRPWRAAAHFGLRAGAALAPRLTLSRFAWIHDHDVTAGRDGRAGFWRSGRDGRAG
jgi:salicylate hydroxylase